MVTWIPRETGATLPDGENSTLNYVDILIKHKQENNEERDIILFVNGPGFKPGQIDDLKNKFKGVEGIHAVDLHDPKYDRYWEEIDEGWQISKKSISIKEYYRDMHSMKGEDRALFSAEIDIFKYIAAYFVLREQEKLEQDQGVIYVDFDALGLINSDEYKKKLRTELYTKKRGTEQKGIGQDITIPYGILASIFKHNALMISSSTKFDNDVFAITDCRILQKVLSWCKRIIYDRSKIFEDLLKHRKTKTNGHVPFSNDALDDLIKKNRNLFINIYNLAQKSFTDALENVKDRIAADRYGSHLFDFSENGGEYLKQGSCINDESWFKDIYNKKEGKNEQVSEQPPEPNTLIDGIGARSPSRNSCSIQ